jgi:hypothetical protein
MNSESIGIAFLVGLVVVTAAKWLVYTGLLWGMIKIQKLNYNVWGLFGSSLAATLVTFIPFVGPYLSYAVLVLCLWKCTGADIVPDVVFTVAIAGALMFCVNLWVIGALMGSLRPDLSAHARAGGDKPGPTGADDMTEEDDDDGPTAAKAATARTATANTNAFRPNPAATSTNAAALVLKSVTSHPARPFVMISDGTRAYTVGKGETFTVTLSQGRVTLRCEEITKDSVVVKPAQGEAIVLHLH